MAHFRNLFDQRLTAAAWGLFALGTGFSFPGSRGWIGISLRLLGSLGILFIAYRQRWRGAPAPSLDGATAPRVTYTALGCTLDVRRADGTRERTGWRDVDEMIAALRSAGLEPEVERFDLGVTSLIGFGLGSVATIAVYGLLVDLMWRLSLPDWPYTPLMVAATILPALVVLRSTTASAEVTPERVRLRVGWRIHDLPRGELKEVALITGKLVVRSAGATIRIPIAREEPARRLVRALAHGGRGSL